ncbi:MAG: PqqD family peptide modification chaperone [Planctomycetota bacterium]|jgi:putative peptide zinc metalloprotease protein
MPVDRPTFSESWYRVADLCPRLRSTVQVYRQHYRGVMWHVLQDPTNNQFFRLNDPAYRFVSLLDGRRTVAEVWNICNEQFGDEAPTQGEAIQLLGQLYTSNLLHAELPPDAAGLFQRFQKRTRREIQGRLMNIMFIHIPLIDPDRFLNRWVSFLGSIFSWWGAILWMIMVATGLYFLTGSWDRLAESGNRVLQLNPDDLPLLYLAMIMVKVVHEFGHAFACKKFGLNEGGGEVHAMGIMLLVFTPLPYVDASSAWALRSKWHRIVIGMAGMLVELAVASIAAVVWSQVGHPTVQSLCFNIMFIASVSTILFNANPLLRYDGYYILSDILEIPNLAPRSRQYIYYLVKKYVWGVRRPTNPAHTRGEKAWFCFYGVASTIYRVIICVGILLMIAKRFFFIGVMLAAGAFVTWVLVPLGKFLHYLTSSGELIRVRPRAVLTTILFFAAVLTGIGFIEAPDRVRVEGIIEPARLEIVHAKVDGFLEDFLPNDTSVQAGGRPLITCVDPKLAAAEKELLAKREELEVRRRMALIEEPFAAKLFGEQKKAIDGKLARVREQLSWLTLRSDHDGLWLAPQLDRVRGAHIQVGQQVGMVVSADDLLIRAVAGQKHGPMLLKEFDKGKLPDEVSIRVRRRPDYTMTGEIKTIHRAGQKELPSAALGFAVGGKMATATDDPQGMKAAEQFFELLIKPSHTVTVTDDEGETVKEVDLRLLSGQRVIVRIELPPKPLAFQWWRAIHQMFQRRFRIL